MAPGGRVIRILKSSARVMRRHKLRTFFMMVGVVVGITTLTLVFSIGKGTQQKVMGAIEKIFNARSIMISAGGGRMMGRPGAGEAVTTLTLEDLETIVADVPGIDVWDPMQMIPGREVRYRENSGSYRILGHSPRAEVVWNRGVSRGEFFDEAQVETSSRVALIGENVAQELFGGADPINEQIRIGSVPFRVIGVLEMVGADPHGMNRDSEIYIPYTTAMRRLMNVDYIMAAKLLVHDPDEMPGIVDRITGILRERHRLAEGVPDDFSILTPIKVQQMVARALRIFNVFLPIIAGISLLVGGVVITNLMLISVSERRSEIGLRKAVGARSRDILLQFLMEATVITLAGGLVGIVIGLVGVRAFAGMLNIPVAVSGKALVLGILFSTLVGLAAGVFPARRAAVLEPVETLQ